MFFKSIDFLSPQISLYYDNRKRHSSIIGGFLTLILFLYTLVLIIQYSLFNSFPNKFSLKLYRNFETDLEFQFFNESESGIFHFFYIYNNNDIDSEELVRFKSIKNGILRIYMLNLLNPYDYNSSDLGNYDHWVYDSCHNFVIEQDKHYDYSYSFCIQYYYNHVHQRYYSVSDKSNFKWPFFKETYSIAENSFFTTFIEKCTNNSYINQILGSCYPEDRINNYFKIFNNIFISFVDNKFEINDKKEPIKTYSHQIHNTLKVNKKFFSFHQMEFTRFNYVENGMFHEKFKKNSFMFEEDKITKIYNEGINNPLTAFSFHFKKYLNEFRKPENNILFIFNKISSHIITIYFILYIINLFFNEMAQTKDFFTFIIDDKSLIENHINYDKNKIVSIKTYESNENNNQFNSFGNLRTNNKSDNLFASYIKDNNSKFNKKSEIIDLAEKDENDFSKNSENIIFVDGGNFGGGIANNKKNLKLNFNNFETKSMKFDNRKSKINYLERPSRIQSYRKKRRGKEANIFKSLILKDLSRKNSENNSEKNDDTMDNGSKIKIINNSSLSLFKEVNNQKNLNSTNYNYINHKKDMSSSNIDKKVIQCPSNNPNLNTKTEALTKNKEPKNDFINYQQKNKKYSVSTKIYMNNFMKDKEKNNKSQDKCKSQNKKNLDQSFRSKGRNSISNDSNSQISISRKIKENNKQNSQFSKYTGNKINKEKIRQDFQKNYGNKTLNADIDDIMKLKNFWSYFCFCTKNNSNVLTKMSLFRKKLLSEDYIYLLHLNMIIYKKKFEKKSIQDKKGLLEELYYSY